MGRWRVGASPGMLPIETKPALLGVDVVALEVSPAVCWESVIPKGSGMTCAEPVGGTAETQGADWEGGGGAWGPRKIPVEGLTLAVGARKMSWWGFPESLGGGRTSAASRQRRTRSSHGPE